MFQIYEKQLRSVTNYKFNQLYIVPFLFFNFLKLTEISRDAGLGPLVGAHSDSEARQTVITINVLKSVISD